MSGLHLSRPPVDAEAWKRLVDERSDWLRLTVVPVRGGSWAVVAMVDYAYSEKAWADEVCAFFGDQYGLPVELGA